MKSLTKNGKTQISKKRTKVSKDLALSTEILPAEDRGSLDDHDEKYQVFDGELVDEDGKALELREESSNALVKTSPLQQYLNTIRHYPLLSRSEEYDAAVKAYDDGDIDARNTLVTSNLRLVVKIAMGYRRAYAQMLDLIQEGNAGLIQAVDRFNPYRGVKLSTYSSWWIKAYILKFLMDSKSLVRMGTTDAQRKLFFRLKKEAEALYALTQKFDPALLAEKIGVETQDVVEMQQRLSKSDLSLDTPVSEDGQTRQMDLHTASEPSALDLVEQKELHKILHMHLDEITSALNERELYIFKNRIMNDTPMTLQDVGVKFKITRERARQIESKVYDKIKSKFKKYLS